MRIILASASPRRRELLEQIGLDFEVMTSHVEENVSSVRPEEVVEELSRQKAEAVREELLRQRAEAVREELLRQKAEAVKDELPRQKAEAVREELLRQKAGKTAELSSRNQEAILVIGADTVVALDSAVLGKPADRGEAFKMLERLQGRAHEVYTGVTLLHRAAGAANWTVKCFHERTTVHFYSMSEEEITEYVNTDDPLDKAGAYGIQGFCARYISGIEGDYNNVVGLPAGRLYQEIKELLRL